MIRSAADLGQFGIEAPAEIDFVESAVLLFPAVEGMSVIHADRSQEGRLSPTSSLTATIADGSVVVTIVEQTDCDRAAPAAHGWVLVVGPVVLVERARTRVVEMPCAR